MKKNVQWNWSDVQQTAFNMVKDLLSSPLILKQGESEDQNPIKYSSKWLTDSKINYSTIEREALALVRAVNKFR